MKWIKPGEQFAEYYKEKKKLWMTWELWSKQISKGLIIKQVTHPHTDKWWTQCRFRHIFEFLKLWLVWEFFSIYMFLINFAFLEFSLEGEGMGGVQEIRIQFLYLIQDLRD